MDSGARRHYIIAIYGVGNPVSGEIEQTLGAMLRDQAKAVSLEVHEFDWNAVAVHAPRTGGRVQRYVEFFSASFTAAAWCRSSRQGRFERMRILADVAFHSAWATVQAAAILLLVVGGTLWLTGELSGALSWLVRPIVAIGMLPAGVGGRAEAEGGRCLQLALDVFHCGSVLTAALMGLSVTLASLDAVARRTTRPLVETIRRQALILLLVPCVLLSLSFRREDVPLLFDRGLVSLLVVVTVVASLIYGLLTLFFGGGRSTFVWGLIPIGIYAVLVLGSILARLVRDEVGRVWLGGAKVLLDIALYVGTPSYRATIQTQLDRLIAAIPDRASTTISIVAHSLGSVIALDSLTNSSAWRPADRVQLVTLGSPIRRFFNRFFPGAFFASDIDEAASAIARRVGQFTWVNAFRRLDYVGTALRFRRSGVDVPTGQWWPLHTGYWGDQRVARVVVDGLRRAEAVPPHPAAASGLSAPSLLGLPAWAANLGARAAVGGGVVVLTAAVVTGFRLLAPSIPDMFVRPEVHLVEPVAATAQVRHERGFLRNSRMHEFRFDFRDEAFAREHSISAAVPGFMGVWSDRRFDYLALARFVRQACQPERSARVFEFGWSVPCTRAGVPIVFDRRNPERFRVTGFDFRPGVVARSVRLVLVVLIVLVGTALTAVLVPSAAVLAVWLFSRSSSAIRYCCHGCSARTPEAHPDKRSQRPSPRPLSPCGCRRRKLTDSGNRKSGTLRL